MKMHYSHGLSANRIAQIVGAFVIVPMIALAVVGIFMAKSADLFEDKFVLHTSLTNSYGLEPGGPVLMSGIPVGKVLSVSFTPQGAIDVSFELLGRYRDLIREDSVATLTKSMVVAGATQVEISMGKGKTPVTDGATIKTNEPKDYLAILDDLKGQFDREVKPVIESVQRTVAEVEAVTKDVHQAVQTGNRILADVEKASKALPVLVASAERTATHVERATASLPELTAQVKRTLATVDGVTGDVRKATVKLPAIMDAAQEAVDNVKATTAAVKGATKDLPRIVHTAHATLDDVNTILRGAKRTFPVSAMVKNAEPPAEGGGGNGLVSLRGDLGSR